MTAHTRLIRSATTIGLVASALCAASIAGAQSTMTATVASAPAAPVVGSLAPDFTLWSADSAGRTHPVALKDLRGNVVVVAFYPKDRTSGCTAEMTKFRDQYATIFGNGVTVLPVSLDDTTSHAGWAKDMHFPFALVSDPGGSIATAYGSLTPGRSYSNRTVFVVGKDGNIVYEDTHFNALDAHAYDALQAAVAGAKR